MHAAELDASDLLATAEGDRQGLARIYDRHAPILLALAERILGRGREAEDVIHDVFIEVWRRAGDYDPSRGSVATWLRLRVRSRALDRLRVQTRAAPPEPPAAGSDAVELAADGGALRAALAGLPAEQRTVLMLGYFEGLSSSEIAVRLGVPPGTVKSRAAAALSKLRAQLGRGAA